METDTINQSSGLTTDDFDILVRKIKIGDCEAFKKFFFLFQPGIYRFLYRYLCDKDAANDLTQDTFIKFWTNRNQINSSLFPKSYLYKIARNLAINYLARNHSISSNTFHRVDDLSLVLYPDQEYDRYFIIDDLQKALNELPERCKTTFILSRFEGFDYSEIAGIMQVSVQTVKNQMNKAISVLKKRLSSHLV
ncbi:MAG TPA: sigma-70 family RNA polymerase sigma factor [Ignavibacteriaceae bacterium]|nr:sigma-70 family RNA polymerase sigma factor [Ignavibacteriaceae bacterium]